MIFLDSSVVKGPKTLALKMNKICLLLFVALATTCSPKTLISQCDVMRSEQYVMTYKFFDLENNIKIKNGEISFVIYSIDTGSQISDNNRSLPNFQYRFKAGRDKKYDGKNNINFIVFGGDFYICNKLLIVNYKHGLLRPFADTKYLSRNISTSGAHRSYDYKYMDFAYSNYVVSFQNVDINKLWGKYDVYIFNAILDTDKGNPLANGNKFATQKIQFAFSPAIGMLWVKRYNKNKLVSKFEIKEIQLMYYENYVAENGEAARRLKVGSSHNVVFGERDSSLFKLIPYDLVDKFLLSYEESVRCRPCSTYRNLVSYEFSLDD